MLSFIGALNFSMVDDLIRETVPVTGDNDSEDGAAKAWSAHSAVP
jgi:hypothetical protein